MTIKAPMDRKPFLLSAYLWLSARLAPLGEAIMRHRVRKGKDDPKRLSDKRGESKVARPAGKVVWFYAASVGEVLAAVEIIRRIQAARPEVQILVTSSTRTSIEAMDRQAPEGVIYRPTPMDIRPWVAKFLDHWEPDLAVWSEMDLWPTTVYETLSRDIPTALVNARFSDNSVKRRSRMKSVYEWLLARMGPILVQDQLSADNFATFGRRDVEIVGTVKRGAPPLTADAGELAKLEAQIAGRPVWVAASTHEGEDEMLIRAHEGRDGLMILAPRHPQRVAEIAAIAEKLGVPHAIRSKDQPITGDTRLYIADTIGEMGLWYRLADTAFIAGSLLPHLGGHNPYEASVLNCAVLHGPHVINFAESYAELAAVGASREVSPDGIAEALNSIDAAQMGAAGKAFCEDQSAIERTVEVLIGLIDDLPECR
ncbi:3-deoxy-D-manno-octulosonic acid transferase [Paracoccaceae bacterium GXU_MW_L88]